MLPVVDVSLRASSSQAAISCGPSEYLRGIGHLSHFNTLAGNGPFLWKVPRTWEEQFGWTQWLQCLLCCFLCNSVFSNANKLEVVGRGC